MDVIETLEIVTSSANTTRLEPVAEWLLHLQSRGRRSRQQPVRQSKFRAMLIYTVAASSSAVSTNALPSSEGRVLPPANSTTAPPIPSRSYDPSDSLLNAANNSPIYSSRFGNAYGSIGSYGGLSSYSSPYSRFGGMGAGMYGGYSSSMYGSSMYGGMGYGGYGGYPGYGGIGGFGGYNGIGDPNDPNSFSRRMEAGTQGLQRKLETHADSSDVSNY
jgi:peroxin-13